VEAFSGRKDQSPWFFKGQPHPFVLGSESPRRRDLLTQIGLKFEQKVVATDESWPDLPVAQDAAKEIARRKAIAVAQETSDSVILGADTVVMLDNEPLGKPRSDDHALDMLRRLVGRSHKVITGIALVDQSNGSCILGSETTLVEMRAVTDDELRSYVESGEPSDKAGAYGIQGIGAGLVTRIDGCYFNVVGLPISKVIECLHQTMMKR
jgi:septum formation protein